MQSKENLSTESRSFPDIWASLNRDDRKNLTNSLIDALDSSYVAVWGWAKGKYAPRSKADKSAAASVISKFMGIKLSPETLFPIGK